VGCGNATERISSGQSVTVDCSQGDRGFVYDGIIPFDVEEIDVGAISRPKTKIALLLASPQEALRNSTLPNDGVGLVRMEFMVSSSIRAHPLALLHPELLDDESREEISQLDGIAGKELNADIGAAYFVSKLAEGIGMISAAFHPKPVILRFSDFKTNEYSNLLGGKHFEPKEDNAMLGWRGASRYYDPKYIEGFELECTAVRHVRERMGLANLWIMIPFVRTVQELHDVLGEMQKNGLVRGQPTSSPLKVIMMCEVPSNAILAAEFLEFVDGFSIGSNDLTQLTLGIDRNAAQISRLYDERNDAVKFLIRRAIKEANRQGKYIGICGQAPSDFPDFCEFLIGEGIGSISVQPDRIVATHVLAFETEQKLYKK